MTLDEALVKALVEDYDHAPISDADRAILEASQAVNEIISTPSSRALLKSAREAVRTAHDVILAVDQEVARSRALRESGRAISARAAELIRQAAARREGT